jgi:hypothetical protein
MKFRRLLLCSHGVQENREWDTSASGLWRITYWSESINRPTTNKNKDLLCEASAGKTTHDKIIPQRQVLNLSQMWQN